MDRFFIPLMVAELFLLNQENSYVMFNRRQLVNHGIYQKSVYKIEFYRSENYLKKFSAFSALRYKQTFILIENTFCRMSHEVVIFGAEHFK